MTGRFIVSESNLNKDYNKKSNYLKVVFQPIKTKKGKELSSAIVLYVPVKGVFLGDSLRKGDVDVFRLWQQEKKKVRGATYRKYDEVDEKIVGQLSSVGKTSRDAFLANISIGDLDVHTREAFVPVFEGEVYELYFFNGNLEDPVVLGTWNYNVYPVIDGNKWSAKITNYLANHDWNSFRILAEFLTKFL